MHVSGTTRVFLILGDPVDQVRAPEAFNHLFAKHGVDAVLVPAKVKPAALPGFVQGAMQAQNVDGLWLTIPHKAAVLPLLAACDPLGRAAGAVNAVRRRADGALEGALFDGSGFVKSLDRFGLSLAGRQVLLLGAGGAGRAIAVSLQAREAGTVAVYDPTPGQAADLVASRQATGTTRFVVAESPDPAGHDLVINASPLGLRLDDPLPIDVDRLSPGAAVVDILMKNQPTPLLRACRARGITAHPGFEMMVQQVPEYLRFFGFDDMARAVEEDAGDVRALFEAG